MSDDETELNIAKEQYAKTIGKFLLENADTDWEELDEARGLLSSTRFSPSKTRRLFKKMAAAQPRVAEDESRIVFQTMQLSNKCDPDQDLAFFTYVFYKYGKIEKVLKAAGDAAAFISKKCAVYGISTKTPHPSPIYSLHSNEITLSRIARAFPVQAAKVILKEKFLGILKFSSFFQQDLPLIMQHTIFSGLTPIKHFHCEVLEIAVILNIEISVKLAKPSDKSYLMAKTVTEEITRSRLYVDNITSDDEDEKLEILRKAGVLDAKASGELKLSTTTAALLNKLSTIQALYPLKLSEAMEKLNYFNVPKLY